jgi:DMSO/TMAO reductase YedYZ heme-binding membrane subunit
VLRMPNHLRRLKGTIYIALTAAIIGIASVSFLDAPSASDAWIAARQLYGLWALSLLLTSMLAGPLVFVLPRFPLKTHLMLGRRAFGISSFVMALGHAISYLGPVLSRNWRALFIPGTMWVVGLALGSVSFVIMAVLALTSHDRVVRRLGAARCKKGHQAVYFLLPIVLVHATLLGTDFGPNKGLEVNMEVDTGCLVAMSLLSLAWLILIVLRRKRFRWDPAFLSRGRKEVA